MNESLEKVKAEFDEYLQLAQLKDFMSAVSELLDKKDIELAHMREIAGCFQDGDAAVVSVAKGMLRGCGVKDGTVMMDVMNRAQAAAKLAEDGA